MLASVQPVAAADCAQEATELRAHLEDQSKRANTWNWVWRITFTTAAVTTFTVGIADPFPTLREGLFVSSGKATIGALARWILPLRIEVPAADADACADVAALRKAVTKVAKKQKSLFWLGHFGGIAVNLGGAGIVWYTSTLGQAGLSIAIGYPVGVLSNYTMPRGSWRLYRERESSWTTVKETTSASFVPLDGGGFFSLSGSF